MQIRPATVAAFGIGYVLGSRAGRDPYETLGRQVRTLLERPEVQSYAGIVTAHATNIYKHARSVFTTQSPDGAKTNGVGGTRTF